MRRFLKILAVIVAVPVVLMAIALGAVQVPWAQRHALGLIEELASGDGTTVRLGGLSGGIPWDMRLAGATVADREGVWLVADDIHLRLALGDLWRGRITVDDLAAGRLAVNRLPVSEPSTAPATPMTLPASLPPLSVRRLAVPRIELGAPILGEAAVLSLDGNATLEAAAGDLAAHLDLRRTDQPTASLVADAEVSLTTSRGRVALHGSETGGLVARLTGLAQAGDLTIALDGDGPLDAWKAPLAVEVAGLGKIAGDVALDLAGAPSGSLTAKVTVAPGALPAEIAGLAAEGVDVVVEGGQPAPDRIAVTRLRVAVPALTLDGAGDVDLASKAVSGHLVAALPDLASASALAGTPLAGAVDATLDLSGTIAAPQLALVATGQALSVATAKLATLGVEATASRSDGSTTLVLGVDADGVAVAGQAMAGPFRLDGKATAADTGAVAIQSVALRSPSLTADASGMLDQATRAGKLRLDARATDLAKAIRDLAGLPDTATLPGGDLTIGADVDIAAELASIVAHLTATLAGPTGLPPAVMPVVGEKPALAGRITVEPANGNIAVDGLAVTFAKAVLTGDVALADRAVSGKLDLNEMDLASLALPSATGLAGMAHLAATLRGTLDAPSIGLEGAVEALAVAGRSFERATLAATAAGPLAGPAGDARIGLVQPAGTLELSSRYALAGDRLTLDGLQLTGPGTNLAGGGTVAMATLLTDATLAGTVQNLRSLAPWHGVADLAGRATVDLRAQAVDGKQNATARLDLANFAGGFGTVASVATRATLSDLLGTPGGDVSATVTGLAQGANTVDRLTFGARGTLARLDLDLAANGQAYQPFEATARARLEAADGTTRLVVSRLDGRYAGEPFEQEGALAATVTPARSSLANLNLGWAGARLTGKAALAGETVSGDASLVGLDAKRLRRLGLPPLAGTAKADLELAGTLGAPRIDLAAAMTGVRYDVPTLEKVPPGDVALKASFAARRLTGDVQVSRLTAEPVIASISVPFDLRLQPFAAASLSSGSLSGRLKGEVDLARVAVWAVLDGERLGGTGRVDLGLGGTLAQPALTGGLSIEKGSFEDGDLGTVFRDITLRANAVGDRLVIEEFSGRDPKGGTITGRGSWRISPDLTLPLDLSVTLDKARLADYPLVQTDISGTLNLVGSGRAGRLGGTLTIDRAEINIPSRLGGGLTAIDVVELDGPDGPTEPEKPATPLNLALDVAINAPGRIFVRGRGLDSEWEANFNIRGTLDKPSVQGALRVRRGRLDFLERNFDVGKGEVAFDGAFPPVPTLDVEASGSGNGITVTVTLEGPASKPRFSLSSDPTLPQDEILSRLLFGRSVASISPAQGIRLAIAANQLRGEDGIGLLGSVRRGFGVDTLDIGEDDAQQTTVKVGKYLTDKVYVEVERGVAGDTSRARAQIELTPNISVDTRVDEQLNTGVGLQWKFDY